MYLGLKLLNTAVYACESSALTAELQNRIMAEEDGKNDQHLGVDRKSLTDCYEAWKPASVHLVSQDENTTNNICYV